MKSTSRILFSHISGFILFLILLGIANILIPSVHNSVYTNVIGFFNASIIILLIMMLVGIANEIFWNSYFPASLLAPISSAVLGVLIVRFIYNLWNFLNSNYFGVYLKIPMNSIYAVVVAATLIIGYIIVLLRAGKPEESKEDLEEWYTEKLESKKQRLERKLDRINNSLEEKLGREKKKKESVEWHEVEQELKKVFLNIGKNINQAFEDKKSKDKKNSRKKRKK